MFPNSKIARLVVWAINSKWPPFQRPEPEIVNNSKTNNDRNIFFCVNRCVSRVNEYNEILMIFIKLKKSKMAAIFGGWNTKLLIEN